MSVRYLDLADFLLDHGGSAEGRGVGTPAGDCPAPRRVPLAAPAAEFGGIELYPDLPTKVAVLCARVARNHPLPDGNKRVAYLCAVEFAERNGHEWQFPPGDEQGGEQTVQVIESVASGEMTDEQLAAWVADRLNMPQ